MFGKRLALCTIAVVVLLAIGAGDLLAKKPPPDPDPTADPAIAYGTSKRGDARLMVMNLDGTNQTLVRELTDAKKGRPDWSPDGTHLVFFSDVDGNGIYVSDVAGTTLTKVTDVVSTSWFGPPVWAPVPVILDGVRYDIAYADRPTASSLTDIFLISLDGQHRIQLTNTPDAYETFPTWAPSGQKLAVRVSLLDGESGDRWAILGVTGTYDLRRLQGPLAGTVCGWPAWSNTQEDKIAWISGGDVWVVDLDTPASPVRLTSTPGDDERYPSWTPDDSEIVFFSSQIVNGKLRGGGIEVMSAADGSNRRRVLDGGEKPASRRNP